MIENIRAMIDFLVKIIYQVGKFYPENFHVSNIIQTEHVIFMIVYLYREV